MLEELEDDWTAVGQRLAKVRKILNLSKRDFAGRAGITEQVYGAFENGNRNLSLPAAKELRKTYGLSLEFLYFGKIDDLPTRLSKHL